MSGIAQHTNSGIGDHMAMSLCKARYMASYHKEGNTLLCMDLCGDRSNRRIEHTGRIPYCKLSSSHRVGRISGREGIREDKFRHGMAQRNDGHRAIPSSRPKNSANDGSSLCNCSRFLRTCDHISECGYISLCIWAKCLCYSTTPLCQWP